MQKNALKLVENCSGFLAYPPGKSKKNPAVPVLKRLKLSRFGTEHEGFGFIQMQKILLWERNGATADGLFSVKKCEMFQYKICYKHRKNRMNLHKCYILT